MAELVSALVGVSVATLPEYETLAGISVLPALRSSIVDVLIVLAFIASLKVTRMAPPIATLVAPLEGWRSVIVGAVVSGPVTFWNTTSTQ